MRKVRIRRQPRGEVTQLVHRGTGLGQAYPHVLTATVVPLGDSLHHDSGELLTTTVHNPLPPLIVLPCSRPQHHGAAPRLPCCGGAAAHHLPHRRTHHSPRSQDADGPHRPGGGQRHHHRHPH